jgi:hypothetical protein
MGKYLRNHARFSRNKGDSAIQPGYILEKAIPVNLWYLVCKKLDIIIKHNLESLYDLAPMKPYPSAMAIGLVNPCRNPSRSCKSAIGYTPLSDEQDDGCKIQAFDFVKKDIITTRLLVYLNTQTHTHKMRIHNHATYPPPTVLSFPVTLPTIITRGPTLDCIKAGKNCEIMRKWDKKLICIVCS